MKRDEMTASLEAGGNGVARSKNGAPRWVLATLFVALAVTVSVAFAGNWRAAAEGSGPGSTGTLPPTPSPEISPTVVITPTVDVSPTVGTTPTIDPTPDLTATAVAAALTATAEASAELTATAEASAELTATAEVSASLTATAVSAELTATAVSAELTATAEASAESTATAVAADLTATAEASPSPSPTATATVASGGGGGGGAAPPPQPTPTPLPPQLLAPGPPENVMITPGDHKVTITWSPPSIPGRADVTGYLVRNFANGQTDETGPATLSIVVTALHNGTEYQFQVRALSDSGPSAAALTQPATPFGVPSAPTGASWVQVGENSVEVTWEPSTDDGGSELLGYTVRGRDETGKAVVEADGPPESTSLRMDGVPAGIRMMFSVVAVNLAGDSDPSEAEGEYFVAAPEPTPTPISVPASVTPTAVSTAEPEPPEFADLDFAPSALQFIDLVNAVSDAVGVPVSAVGQLQRTAGPASEINFLIPVNVPGQIGPVQGPLDFESGEVKVTSEDGVGVADLRLSAATSLAAAVTIAPTDGGLAVNLNQLRLLATAFDIDSGNTYRVDMDVDLLDAEAVSIPAVSMLSPDEVRSVFESDISSMGLERALMGVSVTGGPARDVLGATRVNMALSRRAVDISLLLEMVTRSREVVFVKIAEGGELFTAEASCDLVSLVIDCSATFEGEARGFSQFVMAIGRSVTAAVDPEASSVQQPTPTAGPTVVSAVTAPTATPLPRPTVPALEPGGDDSTGNLALWVAIGVMGLFALSGTVAVVRMVFGTGRR